MTASLAAPSTTSAARAPAAANGIRNADNLPGAAEITASDPYKQEAKNAMKALIKELNGSGETSRGGVTFRLSKSDTVGFTKVEMTSNGKKLELLVHDASGDIRRPGSTINGKSWDDFTGRVGVLGRHDEIRPFIKVLVEGAPRQPTATTPSQALDVIPKNGEKSLSWAILAETVAKSGVEKTVGSIKINSSRASTTSSTAGDSAEVSYNVTVAVGDSGKTTFRIGQNGTITGVDGNFDAINSQIAAHNKAHKSKEPTQGHAPQTELAVARQAFDEAMKGTVGWALQNLYKTANTSGGSFTSSSYSYVGTPPRAPIDPMSSSTSGSCYLRVKKVQGGEEMELVIKGRRIVGYSMTGQTADTELTKEDFDKIRRFIWEVNPVTEKKP